MPGRRAAQPDARLIGGRERRAIVIADYDPSWAARFEQERDRVKSALGPRAVRIEHIGSTSVPGLAAKPVVDLAVAVTDPEDTALLAPLEAAGYELRVREPGHRMFRTPARDVHIHVLAETDPEFERHLRFRDRLRTCAEDRGAYERLKRELARRDWDDMNAYADAKRPLIEEILSRSG